MKKITTIIIFSLFGIITCAQEYKSFPMWDHSLPFEERVRDVVSRLTLEEKVAQMLNAAPAIPRLGIPAYDWWNEVLHGVARTPFKVTVYPQAIGMAATWDTSSLYRMADFSALEGRAIHNKAIALGRTNERYLGLTYWTPNINIFRDPRWGRGQETYGEDPFLTAMLGKAFVRGLQGEDPKYLKAAACAKHFAVHSGPEPSRHSDNFNPTGYDLWNTYLPAFQELIVNANVAGVMCAYNAVNTQPCCANDLLMNNILRKKWQFKGYVTSDCWAIDDFVLYHKTHPDATFAAVDAVLHGTDVECGQTIYKTLVDAVRQRLINESYLDSSLNRLFMIRYRLGMFDPVHMVKYAQTPATVLESPEHKNHALRMARESIVLLRNEPMPGNPSPVLPLSKDIKKLLVIGPNADNRIAVLGNYNGIPSGIITPLLGIKSKLGNNTEVIYEMAVNFTNDTLLAYADISGNYQWENKQGFKAEYFANKELKGDAILVRTENKVENAWQEGQILHNNARANDFSARYTTNYSPVINERITFEINADDGYRVFVNGKEMVNAWQRNRWGAKTFDIDAKKDSVYKIIVEYWQGDGRGHIQLKAGHFKKTNYEVLMTKAREADAIIFVGGISPQLEGEEMKVDFPGFNGGDRTTILLPTIQTALLKKLQASGKPVVFVMMTGSAIATPWESKNIPGMINAWYGGQEAGTAIADVLFGDYNPAGRLPVTFYKSDEDLPGFSDYSMVNRTYRYFKGKALYPFGFGLSYSNFKYDKLTIPASIKPGSGIKVSVRVTNSSKYEGDEVIQLYLSGGSTAALSPIRSLKGFKRIRLKPGMSANIDFILTAAELSFFDENGNMQPLKGKINISVGGGQPDVEIPTSGNVVSASISVK